MKEIKGDKVLKPSIIQSGEMFDPIEFEEIAAIEEPEGWLGDPEEWPILFCRDHVPKETLSRFLQGELTELDRTATLSTCYAYFSSTIDVDGEDLYMHLESALPDIGRREGKMTWLEWESSYGELWLMMGWGVDFSHRDYPVARQLLELGLAPGQWFILKLEPCYSGPDHNGEYDQECEWELISSERLSPSEKGELWHQWLATLYPPEESATSC